MFRFEGRPVIMDEITALKDKGEAQRFIIWTDPHGTLGYLIVLENKQFKAQFENEYSEEFRGITAAFKWIFAKYNDRKERQNAKQE